MDFSQLLMLFLASIFVNNIILARFLGCCPFMGVSTKSATAKGMGVAVIFVLVLAALMTWLAYHYVLVPYGVEYLYTLSFILIIAALVQFVELALKKINPVLYKSLGIFLPLITTNCAVLGVAVINMNEYPDDLVASLVNALGSSVGFLLAIMLMAGIRERINDNAEIPKCLRGLPIALVTAGLMSVAFMGFAGIIK
jgi:electron transport complex protein RnfA